jgi:hypothetical protein
MRIVIAVLLFVVLLLSGCKEKKDVSASNAASLLEVSKPEWVLNRPHSSAFYIGVGSCSKLSQPLDYQTIAKKNALNDLASEISVRVQGQTFLNSLEVNNGFSEEFISSIATSSDAQLEGYEVAGNWENGNEFWVYYRLNKAQYQAQKQAKKSAALNLANDFYQRGMLMEQNANAVAAFDLYMRGIFALQEYWKESNEFQTSSGMVYLDNEIFSALQRMCGNLKVKIENERVKLNSDNHFSQEIIATLLLNNQPVNGMTIRFGFEKQAGPFSVGVQTTDKGYAVVSVNDINVGLNGNVVTVEVDLSKQMLKEFDQNIQDAIIQSFKTESKIVPIETILPTFCVTSNELNYGNTSSSKVLKSAFSGAMAAKGFRIIENAMEADYIVSIDANTKEGGQSNGFFVAYLDMSVVVKNRRTGDIAYSETSASLKGLQLNKDTAANEAYKKGKEKIEQQLLSKVIQAIL